MPRPLSKPDPLSPRQIIETVLRYTLGLVFALAAAAYFRSSLSAFEAIDFDNPEVRQIQNALSIFVVGLYTALIAFIYMIRLRPVSKFPGVFPTVAALLGGFLMTAFLLLDRREDLPSAFYLVAFALVIIGNGLSIMVLSQLGRSFSILPESRRLVTSGAYALVRHPLYLAEAIASIGVALLFLSPAALFLLLTQFAWQFVRMHYEEKVLRESFPEYAAYAKRVRRIIPGVY